MLKAFSFTFMVTLMSVLPLQSEEVLMEKSETCLPKTTPKLLSVQRIYDEAANNAFTDLIDYQGFLFCAFRIADQHAGGQDGMICVLKSSDGDTWDKVACLQKTGIDLRDPKFSIRPDGRLLLHMGGSIYHPDGRIEWTSQVSLSENGKEWTAPELVAMPGLWIWGVTWQGNKGYGTAYQPSQGNTPWVLSLLETEDGLNYRVVTQLQNKYFPSECNLQFLQDGTMVALLRLRGKGAIGTSKAPYVDWTWHPIDQQLGGPHFMILPHGQMWASSRHIVHKGSEFECYTALGPMTTDSYTPELILPSGGDTGYPGMVYRQGIMYISYYSSHEQKTCIYLAKVQL